MKTVYFVRHGESEGNIEKFVQNPSTSLTQKGREQAGVLAQRCLKLPIEIIISSPFIRTEQTAKIIAEVIKKPIEYSELLTERRRPSGDTGKFLSHEDVVRFNEGFLTNLHIPNYRFSDEENFDDLKLRACQAISYLESRPESNILVVTHGVFVQVLAGYILFNEEFTGKEFRALYRVLRTSNTGISMATFDQADSFASWRILTWNDHAHLG